jgi:ubiquitin-protein ligase
MNTELKHPFVDNYGFVKLKIILKENWSPVLSINPILFALELFILDPEKENEIDYKTLYQQQVQNNLYFNLFRMTINYKLIYSHPSTTFRNTQILQK